MIHHWIVVFFSWPNGSIWSNILAWVICGALAILWARRKMIAHHKEQLAQIAANHQQHMEKLEAIHKHLREH
jgi:hypothetical protein